MPKDIHRLTTVVRKVENISDGVRVYELADPDGWELPPFTAGSHVDVHLPTGAVRQYSLCGDPAENRRYRIAVRRLDGGRGGSTAFHAQVVEGTALLVSLPRNLFALVDAGHHVLIAGGIGITPFMSMLHVLRRNGQSFELHYASPTPASTPFLAELQELSRFGVVRHYFSRTAQPERLNIPALVQRVAHNAHVYCCGPASMIDATLDAGEEILGERLHMEAFGSEKTGSVAAFEIFLARSGKTVAVPAGVSVLEALRSANVEISASCEAGVCLECKTRVLEGTPIHRDLLLKPSERIDYFTPCVSRSAGPRLVLDL